VFTSQDVIAHGETGVRSDHTVVHSSYRHTGPIAQSHRSDNKNLQKKKMTAKERRSVWKSTYPPLFSYIQSPLSAMVGEWTEKKRERGGGFSLFFFPFFARDAGSYAQVFFLDKKWICYCEKRSLLGRNIEYNFLRWIVERNKLGRTYKAHPVFLNEPNAWFEWKVEEGSRVVIG
jgi:hypothetical protein